MMLVSRVLVNEVHSMLLVLLVPVGMLQSYRQESATQNSIIPGQTFHIRCMRVWARVSAERRRVWERKVDSHIFRAGANS
jgi:hypothetical protein